jgi:hypothetical protein
MKCRIPSLLSKQSFTRLVNRGKVSPIATAEFEDPDTLQLYSISVVCRRQVQAEEARRVKWNFFRLLYSAFKIVMMTISLTSAQIVWNR